MTTRAGGDTITGGGTTTVGSGATTTGGVLPTRTDTPGWCIPTDQYTSVACAVPANPKTAAATAAAAVRRNRLVRVAAL